MNATEYRSNASISIGLSRLSGFLHWTLSAGFMLYTFVGTNPLSSATLASRAEGSPLDRVVIIALAGLAIIVIGLNLKNFAAIVSRSSGIWVVVAISLISVTWSQYPGLTLRRSILFFCITLICAGIAAGARDLRSFYAAFCYMLSTIVLLNVFVVIGIPSVGLEDLGAKGIYTQKNVAGMVAMTAVLSSAIWTMDRSGSARDLLIGVGMTFLAMIFLILTRSKTSLGLTVLVLGSLGLFAVMSKGGPGIVLATVLFALSLALVSIVGLAIIDFDIHAVVASLTGDATFTGRDTLWAFAYRSAMEYPLLGHGYGAFWDVGPGGDPLLRIDPGEWLGDIDPGIINQAHNGYLELWIQLGLPTMLLAVATVIMAIAKGVLSALVTPTANGEKSALVFMTTMLVVYLLHNLTEASLFIRGIILCNVTMPILFLISRFPDFPASRKSRCGTDQI